jgi:fluoroacetyl-CoA thioesterase
MKTNTKKIIVSNELTAAVVGSGLLPVFSTPSMIAFMENTAMDLIELKTNESSVGTNINAQHLKASAVGETLSCTATLTANEGRKYSFEIVVENEKNEIVGKATHDRFVVDIERFMSKI